MKRTILSLLVGTSTALLVACGGGGGGGSGAASNGVNNGGTSQLPTVTQPKTLVPTLDPAATAPRLTSAICPTFTGGIASPVLSTDADVQAINSILGNADLTSYAEFVRAPELFTYWTRAQASSLTGINGKNVNVWSVGTAAHETLHEMNSALTYVCNSDQFARYYVNETVLVSGMKQGDTTKYGIVSETYPAGLLTSRAFRYGLYITGAGSIADDQFPTLLDELSAYTVGTQFEYRMVSNPNYSYLATPTGTADLNAGGMVDFMLYLQSYLKAARLNHTASYTAIINQAATKAVVQTLWANAETQLVNMYPYSVKAGGKMIVPTDVIGQIYSASFLQELDMVGITHKAASEFSATYLKP